MSNNSKRDVGDVVKEVETITLEKHNKIVQEILQACNSVLEDYAEKETQYNLLNAYAFKRVFELERELKNYQELCKVERYSDTLPWSKRQSVEVANHG